MNNKGILEISYKIENLPIYKETKREWGYNSLLYNLAINDKSSDGELKIRKKEVLVDEIKGLLKNIDNQINIWFSIYRFKSFNFNSSIKPNNKIVYKLHRDCIIARNNIDILIKNIKHEVEGQNIIIAEECTSAMIEGNGCPVVEFPDYNVNLNKIDDRLVYNLTSYIQTKELGCLSKNYPDDMLKRWFLILEEIEENTGNIDYQNIKRARHFVSHSICDTKSGRKVIDFLKRELPKAVYTNSENKEEARFDRYRPDHINFVRRYAVKAEERARKLLMQRLEQHHD